MTEYEYRDLRQRALAKDIVAVAQRLGLQLKRAGANYRTLCPFHDDHHPSLFISPRRNSYKCFSCGQGGNVISLVMKLADKDFLGACQWLLGGAAMPTRQPSAHNATTQAPGADNKPDLRLLQNLVAQRDYVNCLHSWAREFLEQRHIDLGLVERYGIVSTEHWVATHSHKLSRPDGSSYQPCLPAPSLLLPYCNTEGGLINLQARVHAPKEGQRRFVFPIGSHTSLWNPHDIVRLPDKADFWLCEGVTDALALLSSGRTPLALSSATGLDVATRSFIAQQASRLRAHIYSDNDPAGEKLYQQLMQLCPALMRHPLPTGCKDFGQAWAAGMIATRK